MRRERMALVRSMLTAGAVVLGLGVGSSQAQAVRYYPGGYTGRTYYPGGYYGGYYGNAYYPGVYSGGYRYPTYAAPAAAPVARAYTYAPGVYRDDWATGRGVPLAKPWMRPLGR